MTPEHLARVERIFEAALALPAAERDAFLKSECGADKRLREQAEQALRDHDSDSSEFASAVGSLAAQVAAEHGIHGAGTRVGSYELIAPLGRGGMGEVWLAQDTRLGRKVAIKFLLDAFSAGRVERFDQEARAASALNHPNILTVHEFGDEGGRHYIVTEYVEGHTIREMLTRGPLGAAQAVDLLRQAARALDTAHRADIVHRDIKPENLMLRPDGFLKVLDFGLAKLTERESGEHPSGDLTTPGMVIGTVAYMSPEQARGQRVDGRSDLFSLGIVVYEMLAGRAPFGGPTGVDTLAALLEREPPPLRKLAKLPRGLTEIVTRLLRKNPSERYSSAADLLAELDALDARNRPLAVTRRSVAAAALVAACGGGGYWWWRRTHGSLDLSRMTVRELPGPDDLVTGAISADGNRVAYVRGRTGSWSLWCGPVDDLQKAAIVGDWRSGYCSNARFHPDGRSIYTLETVQQRGVWKNDLASGKRERIVPAPATSMALDPSGQRLAFSRFVSGRGTELVVSNADGSESRVLAPAENLFIDSLNWSLDGNHVLVAARPRAEGGLELWAISQSGGPRRVLVPARPTGVIGQPVDLGAGVTLLLWSDQDNEVIQIRSLEGDRPAQFMSRDIIDYKHLDADRSRRRLLSDVSEEHTELWLAETDSGWPPPPGAAWSRKLLRRGVSAASTPAFLPNGQIMYGSKDGEGEIALFDPAMGKSRPVTSGSGFKRGAVPSPDGKYVYYQVKRDGVWRVWRVGIDGDGAVPVTPGPYDGQPMLSGDGQMLYYQASSRSSDLGTIMRIPAGGGTPEAFAAIDRPPVFDRDSRQVAWMEQDPVRRQNVISVRSLKDSQLRQLPVAGPTNALQFSPDGKSVVAVTIANRQSMLWMYPIDGAKPMPILTLGPERGIATRLSPDGRKMTFLVPKYTTKLILFEGFRT